MRIMGMLTETPENETLVEKFDFIEAECVSMTGFIEVNVRVTDELLPDEIVNDRGTRDWVERAVQTHIEDYLSSDKERVACDARAVKLEKLRAMYKPKPDYTEYSVWVQIR
jgi:hypothetical protein